MAWRGGEGVVDGGIGASWGGMQGSSSSACTHSCSGEHWGGGELGFWPREWAGSSALRLEEGTSLPRHSPHQLCLPGPGDPLPDG